MNSNPEDKHTPVPSVDTHRGKEETSPLWTVLDVARYLQVGPDTVRAMARDGKIPAIKVGKSWRFQRAALKTWLHLASGQPDA